MHERPTRVDKVQKEPLFRSTYFRNWKTKTLFLIGVLIIFFALAAAGVKFFLDSSSAPVNTPGSKVQAPIEGGTPDLSASPPSASPTHTHHHHHVTPTHIATPTPTRTHTFRPSPTPTRTTRSPSPTPTTSSPTPTPTVTTTVTPTPTGTTSVTATPSVSAVQGTASGF